MALIAWQAIKLQIPQRWSPLKLEGDFSQGYLLLADLHRPRVGVRWSTPSARKLDPAKIIRKAMLHEVGNLAAAEAQPLDIGPAWQEGLLYIEPDPPGRDVWIGYSAASGRVVQVVHHAHRRERILREAILPALEDAAEEDPRAWSVFDLSCRVPSALALDTHLLNAGDLTLAFASKKQSAKLRQIAVAELALKRRSLEQWLQMEQRAQRKYYRPTDVSKPITVTCQDRELKGFSADMPRRRRFKLAWKIPDQLIIMALHDPLRDRLLVVQGSDDQLARALAESTGWASSL